MQVIPGDIQWAQTYSFSIPLSNCSNSDLIALNFGSDAFMLYIVPSASSSPLTPVSSFQFQNLSAAGSAQVTTWAILFNPSRTSINMNEAVNYFISASTASTIQATPSPLLPSGTSQLNLSYASTNHFTKLSLGTIWKMVKVAVTAQDLSKTTIYTFYFLTAPRKFTLNIFLTSNRQYQ